MGVCVSCPPFFEAPRFALRGGLGYVSPAPPEQPRRTSLLSTRAVVLGVTSFGAPPFFPKRSVCNSKDLLRAPRFCVRARLDTLRFCSGELGSDFVVPWSFLEFPVKIPQGIVYGLSWAGFWATWAVGPPPQRARL